MALPIGEHVIEGLLSGVEPKSNGWFKFSITQAGNEYPDKVDTSKQEIIQQALALLNQQVSASVNVTDSGNPNPHRPGTNFLNRYLNAIGPPGTFGQTAIQQNGQPQGQTVHAGGGEDPVKALRIARQNGAYQATAMLAAGKLPPEQENMVGLVEVAEAWVAYTMLGPARFGVRAFNEAAPDNPGNPGEPVANAEQVKAGEDRNTAPGPCPDCGAAPGELHAEGCIPF